MKDNRTLVIASVLSLFLSLFHITDDIVRGFERGGPSTFNGVIMAAVWLYGALALNQGRLGHAIMLFFAIGGAGISYVHMRGAGLVGGRIANSSGMYVWVLTLLVLGALSLFSAMLAARGLWILHRQSRRALESAS
jgi:hypothetical protein